MLNNKRFIGICMACISLIAGMSPTYAQNKRALVSGNVKGTDGNPVAGVIVNVDGTKEWSTTNLEGNYSINVTDIEGGSLSFSIMGMKTVQKQINGQTVINVSMSPDYLMLEETIAIGYGVAKKSDITGAVSSVSGSDLTVGSSRDVLMGLQGKAAGVNITPGSGAPGTDVRIRIRGVGTINNSDPIFVVDGFQISDIDYLSVGDIESIEILKDASATAIYGSRGANGVVLISTKKGSKEGTNLSVNYSYGMQSATKKVDMLEAWQFATLYREAYSNAGIKLSGSDDAITHYVMNAHYKGTDWQDVVFDRFVPVHNADVTLSGTAGKNTYLISSSYINQKGLVMNSGFDKINIRANNTYRIYDNVHFDTDISYSVRNRQSVDGGVLTSALYMDPIAVPWDTDRNNYGSRTFNAIEASNPYMVADLSENNNKSKANRFVANASLNIDKLFVEGLTFVTRFGFNKNYNQSKSYWPEYSVDETTYNKESSLYEGVNENTSWMWSNVLTYELKVKKHLMNIMGGTEMQKFEQKYTNGTAYSVPNDIYQMYFDLSENAEKKKLSGGFSESALMSFFSRLNYKYDDRFLLTATLRADGCSKFLGEHRWGFFPSAAAAWDIKKENFLKNVKAVSVLKLRAGWGVVGNQNSLSNPYVYASKVTSSSNNYTFNDILVNGYYPSSLSNKDIRWESTETVNVGLDVAFLDNKLYASANAFQNTTKDMIATPQAPLYAGYDAVPSNIGSMRNTGLEITAGYKQKIGDFYFNADLNVTTIKNKVLSIGTSTAIRSGTLPRLDPTTLTDVGTEIGSFYGLGTYGVFTQETLDELHAKYPLYQPNAKPGDLWFVDIDGDHKIDKSLDRTYLGSAMPDFTAGMNLYMSWKGFELSCNLIGSYGNEIVNGQYVYINGSNIKSNWSARMWDRSTIDHVTDIPRMDLSDTNGNTSTFSDVFIEDGSYIRMKNIRLGYNLPESIISKINVKGCKVYIACDNLFTITGYSGWDPESVAFGTLDGGVDYGTYPLSRVLTAGINLNF